MTKAIEDTGLPIVQIANLTPIAKTVGANRIVSAFSIPYPMGDPNKTPEDEFAMRERIVNTALDALTEDDKDQVVHKVNFG
jgi:glycine reductase